VVSGMGMGSFDSAVLIPMVRIMAWLLGVCALFGMAMAFACSA